MSLTKKYCTELFNTEKVLLSPLATEQEKEHNDSDKCFICQKKINCYKKSKYYKNIRKVKDHDHGTGIYRGAAHSLCNLRYSTQKDIPIVFHNGSKYDFHLIIKELANEFRSEIHCIPEDKEKYKPFSIPIMYKTVHDYEVPYSLRFIGSNNFMMGSLEPHVENLTDFYNCNGSDKSKKQIGIDRNKKYVYSFCETCKKRTKHRIELLVQKFPNTYQLVNGNTKKFILLFKKGIYPYEYMNNWNRYNETELPSIDKFYSNLNLKDISKKEYEHAQKVWKVFNIKNLGEYNDLYVQSDTTQLEMHSNNLEMFV